MATLTIPLTQGKCTIIDEADEELVRPYCWYALRYSNGFYAVAKMRRSDGTRNVVGLHRFLLGQPPGLWVDHINGDPLDNRRLNLRIVTPKQSAPNRCVKANAPSAYKGVGLKSDARRSKPWEASIRVDGRLRFLGNYATPEEAAHAYDAAARALFGPFARCNFTDG